MKRALDVAVSAVLLVVLAPVVAALAVLVRATSRGPTLHRARRIGRGGDEFTMYKLRTMRADASGPRITGRDDPRVTRLGRFLRATRLDELPQLWNVLRQLVEPRRRGTAARRRARGGVRARHRDEEERLPAGEPEEAYARDILPGKLAIDLAYARGRSFLGDIAILLRTIGTAFRR